MRDSKLGQAAQQVGLQVFNVFQADRKADQALADAGRLALTRLDGDLKPVWRAELPLSESSSINPISTWPLPGHVAVMGLLQSRDEGVTSRIPQLVSIDLKTGAAKSTTLAP